MPRLRASNLLSALIVAAWTLSAAEALVWGLGRAGGNGAAVVASGSGRPVHVVLFAAALAAVPALGLGALCWPVLRAARAIASRRRPEPKPAHGSAAPPAGDRAEIVARHARAAAFVVATVGLAAAAWAVLARLSRLQATDLALWLAVIAVVLLSVAWLVAGTLLGRLFAPWVARIDRRLPLPWPRDGRVRLALATGPLGGVMLIGLHAQGALLGRYALAGWVVALALVTPVALAFGGLLPIRSARWAMAAHAAILAAALLGSTAAASSGPRWRPVMRTAEQALGASFGGRLLRWLSDFDHDGAAAWAGGADCAPFDPTRSPLRSEIPGNGIDEDCDGSDGHAVARPVTSRAGSWPARLARPYHVFWLIPDGVRADRIGSYGQRAARTGAFDSLAAQSILFEHAFSQSSATVFSFSSMFAGLEPMAMHWHRQGVWPAIDAEHRTAAERFRALGYRTAIFVSDWLRTVYPELLRGFDTIVVPRTTEDWEYWSQQTAPMVTAHAIELIERLDPDRGPLFFVLHYNDTHYPYVEHPHEPATGDRPIERYDGEIAFTDRSIGSLLDYLRYRRPLWDDSVVVLTSDHGEEFGEHGREHHARTCYGESTRVPLLLRVPGLAPAVVSEPVALVDIVPTLLDLVGAAPDPGLSGRSLLLAAGTEDDGAPPRAIFCAVASQFGSTEPFVVQSVRRGSYLLVEDVLSADVELYDHVSDPAEKTNRADDPALAHVRNELGAVLKGARSGNFADTVGGGRP